MDSFCHGVQDSWHGEYKVDGELASSQAEGLKFNEFANSCPKLYYIRKYDR